MMSWGNIGYHHVFAKLLVLSCPLGVSWGNIGCRGESLCVMSLWKLGVIMTWQTHSVIMPIWGVLGKYWVSWCHGESLGVIMYLWKLCVIMSWWITWCSRVLVKIGCYHLLEKHLVLCPGEILSILMSWRNFGCYCILAYHVHWVYSCPGEILDVVPW